MILNPDAIPNKYKCKYAVMKYLTYTCYLPLLSFDGDYFYFTNTTELKASLKKMPLYLKVLGRLVK